MIVVYDISTTDAAGEKRLRHIAKECEDMGQRVQESVFECLLEPQQIVRLKQSLLRILDKRKDSLRMYYLGKSWRSHLEHYGVNRGYDPVDALIL